jgi:hypothetical protein
MPNASSMPATTATTASTMRLVLDVDASASACERNSKPWALAASTTRSMAFVTSLPLANTADGAGNCSNPPAGGLRWLIPILSHSSASDFARSISASVPAPAMRSRTMFRSTTSCLMESSMPFTLAGDVASRRIRACSMTRRASLKFACAERAWLTAINGPS